MPSPLASVVADALAAIVVVAEHPDDPSLSRSLHRRRHRGEFARLARGLHVPRDALAPLTPWQVEELRCWAVALHGRVRRPLCRESAARLWGVPLLNDEFAPVVHALGWDSSATRRTSDVHYWATPHDDLHVVRHGGVDLTDLPRTLAELAANASFERGVVAIDWGIRARHRGSGAVTTVDEIRATAELVGIVRGRARLERALAVADGRSESPGESWARVLFHQLGFEAPDLQHEYRMLDGRVFRTDFRWASIGLAGEFDGLVKYRAGGVRGDRSVDQVVIEEKEREDAVRSTGDGMLRLVWADLQEPRLLAHRLESAHVPRRRRASH